MANIQETLTNLPKAPGVYLFKNRAGKVIYVGKAINLYRRVHQYFSSGTTSGPKTLQLVGQIAAAKIIPTLTEFDALILEAKLIRYYDPYYNSIAKDDRSPLYVYLTLRDELPRVILVRKTVIDKLGSRVGKNSVFGPFQSSRIAKMLLRTLRRIVPYCTQKRRDGKACFYTHLGYCGPCPSLVVKMSPGKLRQKLINEYRSHIFRLSRILSGATKTVIRQIETEMHQAAGMGQFERANQLKKQRENLYALLSRKYDPNIYWENEMSLEDITGNEVSSLLNILQKVYPLLKQLTRIEAIDVSNTSGQQPTGSLVVMTNGRIDTSGYRRFKIKSIKGLNDFGMIAEVLRRRLKHTHWPLPDLLVIDGGKGQLSAAIDVLKEQEINLPVVGLAKRFEEIIAFKENRFITLTLPLTSEALHLVQRLRDEAHRFALTYHRYLRRHWESALKS